MATQHLSSASPTPAASRPYRQARTGYGKQTVLAQGPSGAGAFACLPERERYVAGYVDHLPDGAAMDIKSLAKDLPLYGQMAIGTALRALAVAGHLRRVRCRVEGGGQCRWVTLTYWSRTAHDNEWWAARLAGEAATAPEQAPSAEPAIVPQQRRPGPNAPTPPPAPDCQTGEGTPSTVAPPSPAYLTLAELGRSEPRLALSAADCAALEPFADAWFARGVSADYLTSALTAGLPERIGSPIGLVRRRLTDKMPPHLPVPAQGPPGAPVRSVLVECTDCGRPGPAEALPDGLCRPCATTHQPAESPGTTAPAEVERDVPALVAGLRNLMRTP
ncbi:MarR family transcriptional regulator [Streptomyces sp. AK04-4c]|uniref:MarR family transcriptional regulator n=1 Tax=Streptomyces sp. AK04-4c TaxID=3028651 RepID=UPI0029A83817|nr:MarR family transcriptional regulator [Streptomyces sp. AK04-4c]MDX3687141.1 MarR family transcriptional regulator [Streptomyces sp. AK04-4c]WSS69205.1 MarR family transcriptional regulator [Streptomyces sp. NBC_01175]